ncbi:ParA family protein, partial [Streptomyces althioticus]|uniref:ParA family protein n=1 Tax=Streptomyces althioticus TaxID=83380 RepID=UPI0036F7C8A2
QVAEEVRTHFRNEVLSTAIPRSVRISEAPSYGQTVLTYDPGSTGALSYLEAARELAQRAVGPGGGSVVGQQRGGSSTGHGAPVAQHGTTEGHQ